MTSKPEKSTKEAGGRPHVTVIEDRCAGCQECLVRCPTGAIAMNFGSWIVVADDDLCSGCRQCVRTCAFSAITVTGPMLVSPRAEMIFHHPEELPGAHDETRLGIDSFHAAKREAERCLVCPDPTCVRGCPAHNDIPSFISSLREGDLESALETLRLTSVLPDVCARVCDQAVQCEGACSWSLAGGEPVAIGALERFITDNAPVAPPRVRSVEGSAMRVAIIGAGPAGLSAAWDLYEARAQVTIFDRDNEPGGLLRWGIPDFTLPEHVALRSAKALQAAGVQFRFGVEIDADGVTSLLEHYDAVLLAVGAGTPMRVEVPGTELDGVWDASHFLTTAHDALSVGHSLSALDPALTPTGGDPVVLVLGAGNTAMDVARTARRLGAKAICVDWMDRRFAPVRPDELDEAEEEGVEIHFSTTLLRLGGEGGRVATAELVHTTQKSATVKPKINSRPHDGISVDLVVMAMGYRVDTSVGRWLPDGPVRKTASPTPDRRWVGSGLLANAAPPFARSQPVGRLALGREVARRSAGTPRSPRLWAAGDALTGPSTVVEAMAQGRQAARGMLREQPRRPVWVTPQNRPPSPM